MSFRTKKEIVRLPGEGEPSLSPLGERLWRPTSTVRPRRPLREVRGALKPVAIHSMRGGKCVVRPWVVPSDPRTERQMRRRDTLARIARRWSALPAEARLAWRRYAERHLVPDFPRSKPGDLPLHAWVRAQTFRLGMGLPPADGAPATPPPADRIAALEELPPAVPGSFRFRLRHAVPAPEGGGLRVLFELTGPLASPRRRARRNDFRWAGAADPDSFFPMEVDGAVYEIREPSVNVPAGAPYAVRVRLVTEEGLAGEAAVWYLVRR